MHYQFERADRRRRVKAIIITIGVQVTLLALLVFGGQLSLQSILPEGVQEALGLETAPPPAPAASEDVVVRP